MPPIGRQTRSVAIQELTPQEIQKRWGALLPKVVTWMVISVVSAVTMFVVYHFNLLGPKVTNIAIVGFQISCIFVVMFVFLTLAASFFKSNLWVKKK